MRSIFRREALAHQQQRYQGAPLIAHNPAVGVLVAFVTITALAIICLAFWGEYTRKEHVSGYLSTTRGLMKITTPQNGTIQENRVREGQSVKNGDVLLVLSSERATTRTAETTSMILAKLQERKESLRLEQRKQGSIDVLTESSTTERIRGLALELVDARQQMDSQRNRVSSAQRSVTRQEQLVAEHFSSQAALEQKQEELIDQRNQLSQIQRTVTSLTRELTTARLDLEAAGLKRSNNAAGFDRQMAELDQQLVELDSRRNVVLTAPADGTITTILVDVGQSVTANVPLLTILPIGAELEAQLLVPTRAAGFIKQAQGVALRYQAFPYQRFGHHLGAVVTVGRTVIQPNEANLPIPITEPVYRVTVKLPVQQVMAYGQAMSLQSGMLVDADIRVDTRPIIEWIFDPLFSITGRV